MGYPVRPSGYVGWGSTGFTNVVEPTDAQKGTGWATNQAPPSSYFNWLQNKQDQWIQYLDWRSRGITVAEENAVPNPGPYGGVTGSTNGGVVNLGIWQYYTPSQINTLSSNWDITSGQNGRNSRQYGNLGSGYAHIFAGIGSLPAAAQDYRIDHIVSMSTRALFTSLEMGIMYNHSGVSGCNPVLGWACTGKTGLMFAQWIPSGKTPTSMSFPSAYSQAAAGWLAQPIKFTIEARGPTMTFYANDVLQGAAPNVALGVTSVPAPMFGLRVGGSNSGTLQFLSDWMRLQIYREPGGAFGP